MVGSTARQSGRCHSGRREARPRPPFWGIIAVEGDHVDVLNLNCGGSPAAQERGILVTFNVDIVQVVKGMSTRTLDTFKFAEADESKKFQDTFNKFYVPADKALHRTSSYLVANPRLGR